ncbi:MAG: hypothetical protein ACQER9_04265, partial [Nanobdellota archaeon]
SSESYANHLNSIGFEDFQSSSYWTNDIQYDNTETGSNRAVWIVRLGMFGGSLSTSLIVYDGRTAVCVSRND